MRTWTTYIGRYTAGNDNRQSKQARACLFCLGFVGLIPCELYHNLRELYHEPCEFFDKPCELSHELCEVFHEQTLDLGGLRLRHCEKIHNVSRERSEFVIYFTMLEL